jgi:hypothetical protein
VPPGEPHNDLNAPLRYYSTAVYSGRLSLFLFVVIVKKYQVNLPRLARAAVQPAKRNRAQGSRSHRFAVSGTGIRLFGSQHQTS